MACDLGENFEDLERAFDSQYERLEVALLGEGTYGKVYKARQKQSGLDVAMKQMKLDNQEEGVPSTAIREIALLKELSHRNVVRLLDVFCKPTRMVLVFEFVETDLKKYMKSHGRLSPTVIKSLSYQMLSGVNFCHANRVIHRDLKPQNLLVDKEARLLKIADFGLARAFSLPVPVYTHEVVTVWYRPPEILLGSKIYSIPVDLWSSGCIVAEMATGAPLFAGDSEIDTIFKIFMKFGTPTEEEWPGVLELPDFKPNFPHWARKPWQAIRNTAQQVGDHGINLLEGLTQYDPRKRISARSAMAHPYFADLDRSSLDG